MAMLVRREHNTVNRGTISFGFDVEWRKGGFHGKCALWRFLELLFQFGMFLPRRHKLIIKFCIKLLTSCRFEYNVVQCLVKKKKPSTLLYRYCNKQIRFHFSVVCSASGCTEDVKMWIKVIRCRGPRCCSDHVLTSTCPSLSFTVADDCHIKIQVTSNTNYPHQNTSYIQYKLPTSKYKLHPIQITHIKIQDTSNTNFPHQNTRYIQYKLPTSKYNLYPIQINRCCNKEEKISQVP